MEFATYSKVIAMEKRIRGTSLVALLFCLFFLGIAGCVKRVPLPDDKSAGDNATSISKSEFEKLYIPPQILAAKQQKSGKGPLLYPGDEISIQIYDKGPGSQESHVERKRINDDGVISLLPVKEISIGGLTITEAEKLIERKLSEFIVSPFVEIEVTRKAYEPQIYVFGETGKNGIIKIREGYRLLDVIAETGGYGGNAYKRSIKIIRVVDQKVAMISIDASSIIEGHNLSNNILLQDQDILYVPKRLLISLAEVLNLVSPFMPLYYYLINFK
jgi:protein involved in polysaccharide export with SLBB domain